MLQSLSLAVTPPVRRETNLEMTITNYNHRAVLITFYRFFLTAVAQQHTSAALEESWRNRIQGRLEHAAVCTNTILDCIAQKKLVSFAGPMT
jgi:hypothetical protein